jgi:UDP-N-acetylmuramoyl-tripeptide--D-alanyl-D-alanine ligase
LKLTLGQIADILHAEGDFLSDAEAQGYSIDSRTLAAGELFFAVKGERVDGHHYVAAALENGAVAAVVSMGWLAPDEIDTHRLLRVPDSDSHSHSDDCVLNALQTLAHAVRKRWGLRVIGVTGSAGKTTTKDAVAQVLATRFHILKTEGNLNNGFGLPLQLLKLDSSHEVAVIEMGMNHAGEITALAKIAEPDWGVVSNVAPVHLEFFPEGLAGIASAKYELIEALPDDGLAFLNADDNYVSAFGRGLGRRAVFYGKDPTAQVRAENIVDEGFDGVHFTVVAEAEQAQVRLHLLGRHNVSNALAAIAVGVKSGISLAVCATALADLRAGSKRGELLEFRGAKLVNDCYNSNPLALDAMTDALLATPARRHIVVAGEMLELGPQARALHAACGQRMAQRGVSVVLGVRGQAESLAEAARGHGAQAQFYATPEEAGAWLRDNLRPGDAVLLKASRGVQLERALDPLFAARPQDSDTPPAS